MTESGAVRIGHLLVNPVTGNSLVFTEISPTALVLEAGYAAGGPLAVAHLHPAQEERFRVLEGAVRVPHPPRVVRGTAELVRGGWSGAAAGER